MAYEKNHRKIDALRLYERIIALDPSNSPLHQKLGRIYEKSGKTNKALNHYKVLSRLNPKDTNTHRKLGTLYAAKDETQKSLRHYNIVIRLDPNDTTAHHILANYYGEKGKSLKAAPHYRELVRLDPHFALAYNELRQETGKFSLIENPIGRYNNALKILPNDPDLHFKIALYFFIVDDFNQTLKHFNKSIRLQPKNGKTHYFTGLIHHLMGNGVSAVNHMKRAEQSFVKQKQVKSIADVRRHLRVYQDQYGILGIKGDGSSIASTSYQQKKYN